MGKCNKMRRIVLHISTVMICFAVFAAISAWNQYCKKDNTGVPDAISSICAGSECRLTVSANTSCIEDKEAFAYEGDQNVQGELISDDKIINRCDGMAFQPGHYRLSAQRRCREEKARNAYTVLTAG